MLSKSKFLYLNKEFFTLVFINDKIWTCDTGGTVNKKNIEIYLVFIMIKKVRTKLKKMMIFSFWNIFRVWKFILKKKLE